MADPVTIGGIIKAIGWLRSLGSFLPSGGGPNRLIIDTIKATRAAQPVTERGTLGSIPFPSSPPLVPVPGSPGLPPPPSSPPGFPGGSSIPDRIGGRPVSIGGFLGSILRGGWIGALFYPSANPRGRGSQLCIETEYGPWCPPGLPGAESVAAPRPVAVPGQRGRRRPRAVPAAPGRRRRARPGVVPGAVPIGPPRPRGRPVTITRPRVETRPDVAVLTRSPPTSSPLPPPVPSSLPSTVPVPRTGTIAAPRPATVPATSSMPLPTIAGLVLPALGAWVSAVTGPTVGAIAGPIVGPIVGPLPITGPLPGPGVAPRPQPLPRPLTAFNTAPATSAARDLDEQCRARARARRKKRKPRSVCYRGTYVEKRNGTIKRRKEKVRCQ